MMRKIIVFENVTLDGFIASNCPSDRIHSVHRNGISPEETP
jgi:hypothetical protein